MCISVVLTRNRWASSLEVGSTPNFRRLPLRAPQASVASLLRYRPCNTLPSSQACSRSVLPNWSRWISHNDDIYARNLPWVHRAGVRLLYKQRILSSGYHTRHSVATWTVPRMYNCDNFRRMRNSLFLQLRQTQSMSCSHRARRDAGPTCAPPTGPPDRCKKNCTTDARGEPLPCRQPPWEVVRPLPSPLHLWLWVWPQPCPLPFAHAVRPLPCHQSFWPGIMKCSTFYVRACDVRFCVCACETCLSDACVGLRLQTLLICSSFGPDEAEPNPRVKAAACFGSVNPAAAADRAAASDAMSSWPVRA